MGEFRRCRFNGCWGMSDADHGWCGIHEKTQLSITSGDAERAKLAAAPWRKYQGAKRTKVRSGYRTLRGLNAQGLEAWYSNVEQAIERRRHD